ncbi:hypothetical protein Nepgr_010973 [Nepenthes gracilis]|uniref:Zinc finger PHD-type domain-containing protein n=1 Tax=Nepenthes gracilis TaxID=150966 RepID=A0AAD3XLI5_NEPGR|nr:hypothetical protein Nepgr_010973 [Nepenthes gracilis]
MNSTQDYSSDNVEHSIAMRTASKCDAAKDAVMLQKLRSVETFVGDQIYSSSLYLSDQNITLNKDLMGLGLNDHSFLNVRGVNDMNIEAVPYNRDDENNVSFSSVAVGSLDQDRVQAVDSPTSSGSLATCSDIEEKQHKPRTCSRFTEVSFHKTTSTSLLNQHPLEKLNAKVSSPSNGDDDGNSSPDDGDNHADHSDYPSKCPEQDMKINCLNGSVGSAETAESPVQCSREDEDDVSDVEEQDVKVCDICGDAGREDLLAICSRCIDGAEHTYCMREMLDKVPEGDWVCEECKFNEEMEKPKHDHSEISVINEKLKCPGWSSYINIDPNMKVDNKDLYSDGSETDNFNLNKQVLSKRPGVSIKAAPTAKKQALESCVGSSMTSTATRMAGLLRDDSFKDLDKMKVKPAHQLSASINSVNDSSETSRCPITNSVHAIKGTFVKSNSFSTSYPKPKVKLVDEIPQKQKQGIDAKDGPNKMIGKSFSFKGNLGRTNVSEAKVKMLSLQFSHFQDLKGLKQSKERTSVERKNSIRSDHPLASQVQANTSKHQSRGDNVSSTSVSSSRDYRGAQSDGKLATSTRTSGQSIDKISDTSTSPGEVKRQQTSCPNIWGSASTNGLSDFAELKQNHVVLREGPTSSAYQTGELKNLCGITDTHRGSAVDASAVKTSKEVTNEENKLKAAIEAAVRKRLDIYRRNRVADKSNELSVSNMDSVCEMASRDRLSGSNQPRSIIPVDYSGKQATVNNSRHLKVYAADNSVSSSKVRDLNLSLPLYGEPILRMSTIPEHECVWQGVFEVDRGRMTMELCSGVQAHLSTSASYKVLELVKKFPQKVVLSELPRAGMWPTQFQDCGAEEDNIALYFFAKDLESYQRTYKNLLENMMEDDLALKGNIDGNELLIFPSNQLPQKSQRWNMLFFLWGVFRGRRNCLNHKSGSVQKLDISGSLLVPQDKDVFTSPPENQCLCKPKNEDLSVSGSCHYVVSKNDTPASVESSVHQSSSLSNGNCDINRNASDRACLWTTAKTEHDDKNLELHSSQFHEQACSGNKCDSTSVDCFSYTLFLRGKEDMESYLTDTKTGEDVENCSLEGSEHIGVACKMAKDPEPFTQAIDPGNFCHKAGKMSEVYSITLDREVISSHSFKMALINMQEAGSEPSGGGSSEEQLVDLKRYRRGKLRRGVKLKSKEWCLDSMNDDTDEFKLEELKQEGGFRETINSSKGKFKLEHDVKKEEDSLDMNISVQNQSMVDDLKMEDLNGRQFNLEKRHCEVTMEIVACPSASITCPKLSAKEDIDAFDNGYQESTNKTVKSGVEFHGCNHSIQSHDAASTSSPNPMQDGWNYGNNETVVSRDSTSAERYFFPAATIHAGDDSLHRKVSSSEIAEQLPDASPNLELALGVEKTRAKQGVMPFFGGIVDGKKDYLRKGEEDAIASASLSLSLAFPDAEAPPSRAVSNTYLERHEVNTSLLLFRDN